jgi:hypothetical protein
MIKQLFFTAALLVPGLAYAGNPSAVESGQIVPPQSVLPTPMLMGWLQGPSAPRLTTILANAPQYNHIWYFGAAGADTSGAVQIDLSVYSGTQAQLISDIAAWKSSTDKLGNHRTVGISILDCFFEHGTFTAATESVAIVSIESIIDTYGFQGIEWDIESGAGNPNPCWDKAGIESINAALKARYGSNFFTSQTQAPFALVAGTQMRAWMTSEMDTTDIQYYLTPTSYPNCSGIEAFEAGTDGNARGLSQFVNGTDGGATTAASKIIFGQMIPSQGCPVSNYLSAWTTLQGSYPALRGASAWQVIADSSSGWAFASAFGTAYGLK